VPVSNPTSKEPELKILNSDVEGNISYQTESIKNLKNDVSNLMISIKDMNDTFMTLKASLDQKDEEISRLKDGYDATIFRGFILRFTRVDKVLKENLKDKKYSLDALEDIQIQMEDALAECSIEIFSPALGADFKTSEGVADNPKQIDTTDKNKNLTIAEVIQPGYRRRLPNSNDDDFQIITEAKVAIYVYKI
jgi:cell division protein FtsB